MSDPNDLKDAPPLSDEISADDEVVVEEYKIEDSQTTQDDSVSVKAKESARSLKNLISSIANKTKQTASEKANELSEKANANHQVQDDSAQIARLGDLVDDLTANFDDTMAEISAATYDEQRDLLQGYKKVSLEELRVIDARLDLAKRLAAAEVPRSLDTEAI